MSSTSRLLRLSRFARVNVRRNFGGAAPCAQKASDPIQQLFVDKVREYAEKKAGSGGKLVDATPAVEQKLQAELEKVAKSYGGGAGVDMTAFPALTFVEPKLEDVNM